MPSTNSQNLTLTTVGGNVTVGVTYNAVFNPFERRLAGLGLRYLERIQVQGLDEGFPGFVPLANFPQEVIPVTDGAGSQTIARARSITLSRQALQEDPAPTDADEFRCLIEVVPFDLPVTVQAFTDPEVLAG